MRKVGNTQISDLMATPRKSTLGIFDLITIKMNFFPSLSKSFRSIAFDGAHTPYTHVYLCVRACLCICIDTCYLLYPLTRLYIKHFFIVRIHIYMTNYTYCHTSSQLWFHLGSYHLMHKLISWSCNVDKLSPTKWNNVLKVCCYLSLAIQKEKNSHNFIKKSVIF